MRFVSSLLLISFITCSLIAQPSEPPALNGKKALQFSYDGFRVGGGLGGKYWMTDLLALRTTLGFAKSFSESDYRTAGNPESYIVNTENTVLSLESALLRAFYQSNDVMPYAGVGAGIRSTGDNYKYRLRNGTSTESNDRNSSFSLFFLIGAELWITPRVSLSAEQTLGIRNYSSENNSSILEIRTGTSQLLIAFYF